MPALLSVLGLGSPRRHQSAHYLDNNTNPDILAEKVDNMGSCANITKAQMIALSILDTHKQLKKLPTYRPGEEINRLLGTLVHTCVQIHPPNIIQQVCFLSFSEIPLKFKLIIYSRSSTSPVSNKRSPHYAPSAPKPNPVSRPTGPSAPSRLPTKATKPFSRLSKLTFLISRTTST